MPQRDPAPRPNKPQAEQVTLGTLLLEPQRIIGVSPLLHPEDFHDPTYRVIYLAISQLYEPGRFGDFVTVAEEMCRDNKIQEMGTAFLPESGGVRKNRHAPTGRVELFFDKAKMSFRDPDIGQQPVSRRRSGGS